MNEMLNTPKEHLTNRLILEFLGYKLAPCSRGQAWESPYKYAHQDVYEMHGRLLQDSYNVMSFHNSWWAIMPVGEKCMKLAVDNGMHEWVTALEEAAGTYKLPPVYNTVVEFIEFYNKNKSEFKYK